MTWVPAVAVDQLSETCRVVRVGPRQLAVVMRDGRPIVFDNRCPHEGYPLSQGRLRDDCVLTCEWHNWKFDLADGRNLLGSDPLRVYPTRIEDGQLLVDLAAPDPDLERRQLTASLRQAFDDREYDRLARVVARLGFAGIGEVSAIRQAIRWSYDRLEYGMTHAYAAAPDWLELHDDTSLPGDARLAAVVEALDHIAHDALRQPRFPFTDRSDTFREPRFLEAVEAEDESAAVAQLNGAFRDGATAAELEGAFVRAALAHFRDFGHELIYVQKVGSLVRRLGPDVAQPLLCSLVRSLVYSTREDQLPTFRSYASWLAKVDFPARSNAAVPAVPPVGTGPSAVLEWTVAALSSRPPERVLAALVDIAARNLLAYDERFDTRPDLPVNRSFGWLGVTHAVTFAAALAELAPRHPDVWPSGLLQLGCLVGRAAPFVRPRTTFGSGDPTDPDAFLAETWEEILDHGISDPIYSCHLIKTALAARRLAADLEGPAAALLLAGTRRFLSARTRQKHVRRTARQAIGLVGLDYTS